MVGAGKGEQSNAEICVSSSVLLPHFQMASLSGPIADRTRIGSPARGHAVFGCAG